MPVTATQQEGTVSDLEQVASYKFDDCLNKLQELVDRSGQPLEEISRHPAVRPLMKQMRSLLNQMKDYSPEDAPQLDGHMATVTDISTRFKN